MNDESLLWGALEAGAAGYIVKWAVESELINAIRAIARGEVYAHPAVTRRLLQRGQGPRRPGPSS